MKIGTLKTNQSIEDRLMTLTYDGHFNIEQGFTTKRLSEFKPTHHKETNFHHGRYTEVKD